MTDRDEARAKCIETMEDAWFAHYGAVIPKHPRALRAMSAAFDALATVVIVNLPEATEEMVKAMNIHSNTSPENTFRVMARKGNLLNPPKSEEPT